MATRPVWEWQGHDWPNRAASRFVEAGGLRWHVQIMGAGPVLLLVHGTGAATHSWRALAPLLAKRFTVIAPDMPGHGFTQAPARSAGLSLPGMAALLRDLLVALDVKPALVVGHSAGAAVLARMCLDGMIAPRGLVALNGAMLALGGMAGQVFSPIAKVFAALPVVPLLFSWRAGDRSAVEKLLRDTGSTIDPAGVEYYARLIRTQGHVAATLGMMANWDLRPLERDLPRLATHLLLLVGGNDRAIPPADAARLQAMVPGAELTTLPGLGHLAHEERPDDVAALVADAADRWGVAAP